MAEGLGDLWRVKPGTAVDLAAVDTRATTGAPGAKEQTEAGFDGLHRRLLGLHERLWAERRQSVLLVLQGLDAGGKDGTIKHLYRGLHPVGARVYSFRVPSEEERAHDFLWRVHQRAPGKGEIVLFNRSHYEDVLVVRVRNLAPEEVWRPRFEFINDFERNLAAAGSKVVKCFLHISPDEQLARFQARLDDPTRIWKFRKGDLEDRALWNDYLTAYTEMLERTSTDAAPWYVVPGDRKWYRNWVVIQVLIETLESMNPQFPAGEDLEGLVLR